MIQIKRHMYVQRSLSTFVFCGVLILMGVFVVLDKFSSLSLIIFAASSGGAAILFSGIFLLLRIFDWGTYVIDANGITLFRKKKVVAEIKKQDIPALKYASIWSFGFFMANLLVKKTQPEILKNGMSIEYQIMHEGGMTVSPKEAIKIAEILNVKLEK